jgi:hypothetical protein
MNEDVVDAARKSLEVNYKKRFFRTYISAVRPRYRDNKYMHLTNVGRPLASISLSNVGWRMLRTYLPPDESILGTRIRKVFQEQKN